MYGINDKIYNNIINYFKNNKDIVRVILFGSRAKGNEKINSDIDLCIDYVGTDRGGVVEKIDELIGIYSCDIVFLGSINEELKKHIDRDGITIYSKA
jgi:predicted nucleotidyltransferase